MSFLYNKFTQLEDRVIKQVNSLRKKVKRSLNPIKRNESEMSMHMRRQGVDGSEEGAMRRHKE